MSNLKITIDQLKNYLGTGLKLEVEESEVEIMTLYGLYQSKSMIRAETEFSYMELSEIKPICYRLSDLDKFIPDLGFVPLHQIWKLDLGHKDWISKEREDLIQKRGFNHWINQIPYGIIQKLIEWHFWPFGDEYFEKELVIDKMKQV